MTDCHFLSLSNFLVALMRIPATSRVILVDQRPMLPEQPPHFLDDLKNYYQAISIQPQQAIKSQRTKALFPLAPTSPMVAMTQSEPERRSA